MANFLIRGAVAAAVWASRQACRQTPPRAVAGNRRLKETATTAATPTRAPHPAATAARSPRPPRSALSLRLPPPPSRPPSLAPSLRSQAPAARWRGSALHTLGAPQCSWDGAAGCRWRPESACSPGARPHSRALCMNDTLVCHGTWPCPGLAPAAEPVGRLSESCSVPRLHGERHHLPPSFNHTISWWI